MNDLDFIKILENCPIKQIREEFPFLAEAAKVITKKEVAEATGKK